ncbi:MAG: hypothetical protein ABI925_03465 [Verrucomicrobiota bacterium]
MKAFVYLGLLFLPLALNGQVLFDATKAEMAGNADWVVDADVHDLRVSSSGDGSGVRGSGNESDPQRIPTPAIAGITANTSETYWNGSLSAWAVALAKAGITPIETLPVFITPTSGTRSRITYGDASNSQDLSNYELFIVCEPNIAFTAAEKTAILNYVFAGGAIFMVSDHDQSDRNNDGIDSVGVWNDLLGATSVFGFKFNTVDISPTGVADTSLSNPLTHGPAGTVTSLKYVNGATMTITDATIAHAAVWQTSAHSSTQVMALYGTYGAGKFVAVGDSSPIDDGTGDSNDTLFNGWDDASGNDGRLVRNASLWLLSNKPVVTSRAASGVTSVAAVLNATVDPEFVATTAFFQWGTTAAYGQTTPNQNIGAGDTTLSLTANISGLQPNTVYHFRIVASNANGTSNGSDLAFTTVAAFPSVVTNTATNIRSTSATLNGTVSPNGIVTTYHFDFGTTTSYGFTSTEQSAGSGSSDVPVSLAVTGLAPGTSYHYRVTITGNSGTITGNDTSFATSPFIDTDGDGIPDDYENDNGLNPNDGADGAQDTDGDGVSNFMEYLAGTNPRDPTSLFRINSIVSNSNDFIVTFTTVLAKRYQVEQSPTLLAPSWVPVGNVVSGNGNSVAVTDVGGRFANTRFYHVRIVP